MGEPHVLVTCRDIVLKRRQGGQDSSLRPIILCRPPIEPAWLIGVVYPHKVRICR